MRAFISELDDLQNKLLEMGGVVETSIHSSVRSLVERRDLHLEGVWEAERRINRPDIQIDELATRLLALNLRGPQPGTHRRPRHQRRLRRPLPGQRHIRPPKQSGSVTPYPDFSLPQWDTGLSQCFRDPAGIRSSF